VTFEQAANRLGERLARELASVQEAARAVTQGREKRQLVVRALRRLVDEAHGQPVGPEFAELHELQTELAGGVATILAVWDETRAGDISAVATLRGTLTAEVGRTTGAPCAKLLALRDTADELLAAMGALK